jgi:[ribosomal protein S5]-alanine N-acetyltransferase
MINTSRLLIRQFQAQDDTSLYEYLSDPGIYRFEPGEPISLEKVKEMTLERAQGNDFWAVVLKSTQEMVGHLYFQQTEPRKLLTWELGYIFNPRFHNQGYATESAAALVRYGFDHFGIHRVVARCNPENIASWKVLEKIGMRREAFFRQNVFFRTAPDESPLWLDTFEYAILKEEGELIINGQ